MIADIDTRVPPIHDNPGTACPCTLGDIVRRASEHLEKRGIDSPALDARLITAHALNLDSIDIHRDPDRPVTDRNASLIWTLIKRRASGTPTAYITETREFWSMAIRVDERVLIPRPETEALVEEVLKAAVILPPECSILEIGTGSGAVSLALARELSYARIVSTDISRDALSVARVNVAAHGFADRITIREGDLFGAVGTHEAFDIIVSNPPYLTKEEIDAAGPEVGSEPHCALYGGREGLSIIERIVKGTPDHLSEGGFLFLEIGAGQSDAVRALIDKTPGLVFSHIRQDYAGLPRVAAARRHHR